MDKFEPLRQVEYKAAWNGVPVIHLTKGETRGTTVDCAKCGSDSNRQPCTTWNTDVSSGVLDAEDGWIGM